MVVKRRTQINRRLLILHPSAEIGGAETQILNFIRFRNEGWCTTVIFFSPNGRLSQSFYDTDAQIIFLNKKRWFDWPAAFIKLIYLTRKLKPDALYTYLPVPNIVGFAVGKICGIQRIIWGVRVSRFTSDFLEKKDRLCEYLEKALSRGVSAIIANSNVGAEHGIARGLPRDRIYVVHNGIDRTSFSISKTRVETLHHFGQDAFVVGTVSRIVKWKGHQIILEAFKYLREQHSHARLVIVGAGDHTFLNNLKDYSKELNISESILWVGASETPQEWLLNFDVFVLASTAGEGMSNAIAEAMLCGLPIAASDIGGMRELVGDERCLYPPGDSEQLYRLLDRYCRDVSFRQSIGRSGLERITNSFSIRKMCENTWRIIQPDFGKAHASSGPFHS